MRCPSVGGVVGCALPSLGTVVLVVMVVVLVASVVGMRSVVAVVVAGHAPSPGWQWVAPMHALPLLTASTVAK